MALMPGFNTRSAAEVAHQYAVEQLQQQELNLRAQAAQAQEGQQAQEMFLRQQQFAQQQMIQEREGVRADREFAFKGAEQGVKLGMKYDPATKAYRELVAGDPEFARWQENKAQKDAEAAMLLESRRADTIGGRVELAGKLEPFAVQDEGRATTRQIATEQRAREAAIDAEKRAIARSDEVFKRQEAKEVAARQDAISGQMRLAALNHALHLVEVKEALRAKGETAEGTQQAKVTGEARKAMKEAFDQWQEAETSYVTNRKRILEDMVAETAQRPAELSKPGTLWGRNALTREEIIAHPSFRRALAPFDAQRQQALRMSAEAQARYYQAAGQPVPQRVVDTLQSLQPGGARGAAAAAPAPTVKETAGAFVRRATFGLADLVVDTRGGGATQLPAPENAPAEQRPAPAQRGGSMPSTLPGETGAGKPYSRLDSFMRTLPAESQKKDAEAVGAMYALAFDNPAQARLGISKNPVWEQAWKSLDDQAKAAWMKFLVDTGAWDVISREQGNAR